MSLKLSMGLLVLVASFVLWQKRQAEARRVLREVDEGRRCIACSRANVERSGNVVRCLSCGYQASLVALQNAKVSEKEIAEITRPPSDLGPRY